MMMIYAISLANTLMIVIIEHPVSMVAAISMQSVMVSLIIAYTMFNPWFSLILFLVFMGGLMVLFVYISSLASNEEFTQTRTSSYKFTPTIIGVAIIYMMMLSYELINHNQKNLELKKIIMKLYSSMSMTMTLMLMIYLLVVLIICVNIITMHEGPIRSMIKN